MPALFIILTLLCALILHRICLLALSMFQPALERHLAINTVVGFSSDLSLVGFIAGLICLSLLLSKNHTRARLVVKVVWTIFGVSGLTLLACSIPYVEYFGMNFQPFHMTMLGEGESWRAVVNVTKNSSSFIAILLLAPALGGLAYFMLRSRKLFSSPSYKAAFGLIFVGICFNILVIRLRHQEGVHDELRYNPLTNFYINFRQEQKLGTTEPPSKADLIKLRSFFGDHRDWFNVAGEQFFPLYQQSTRRVAKAPDSPNSRIEKELQDFLQSQGKKKPWNVIVVLQESLRASLLDAYGNPSPGYEGLTPNFSRTLKEGISFTETLGAGLGTRHGQLASLCSIYAGINLSLMLERPHTNLTCLQEIFALKGYDNYFFYAGNNHFDNQLEFYTQHRVRNLSGQEDFPDYDPKKGWAWGASDLALANLTIDKLKASQHPFFATMLTLTNHTPHTLPNDAPAEFLGSDKHTDLIRYIDYVWGNFYDRVQKELPNTIIVMLADHGIIHDFDKISAKDTNYESVRTIARIPWAILIPNLPSHLKGTEITTLASNVDVAPTLLALLGWQNERQAFMGENAFERTEPVLLNWFEKLYAVSPNGQPSKAELKKLPSELVKTLNALTIYDLLEPRQKN